MATKFIFEDGDNTPSSILLKNTFNKNNIFFSNGSHNILRKACTVQEPGDIIYIFYDVAPNNAKTVNGYNTLIHTIRMKNIRDMYVIPIICIEYYICQMFYKYNYLMINGKNRQIYIDYLIKNFDWQQVLNNVQLTTYQIDSIEHIYKSIITNTKKLCMLNKFKYDSNGVRDIHSLYGTFYTKDCSCDSKYCPIKCTDDILIKSERLYTQLPLFTIISKEHENYLKDNSIIYAEISTCDLKKERQDFYNTVCNSMNVPKIRVVI